MSALPAGATLDHERHFGAERLRLLDVLAALLKRQRTRGRTPSADALAGMVIEDGEAEGLIEELGDAWAADRAPGTEAGTAFADQRARIARAADGATAAGAPLPLWRAQRVFGLRDDEYDALVLALLVECDARAGRLVAYLNDHPGQPRPTAGLVQALADLQGVVCDPLSWSARPILADGLLTLAGPGPVPTRVLGLDAVQARRLTSLDATPESGVRVAAADPRLLARLLLPDVTRRGIEGWAEQVRAGSGIPVIAVTGPPGSGRTTLLRAAAGAAGRALVEVDARPEGLDGALRMLRRESRWFGAAMGVRFDDDAPDPRAFWETVAIPHDLLLLEAPEPVLAGLLAAAPVEPLLWRCELPGAADRGALWQAALPPGLRLPDADAEALAGAFRLGPAAIAHAVGRADAERGTGPLDRSALARAAREQVAQALGPLADRLPQPYRRADLVLPAETDAELDLALGWVRHQAQVLDRWGLGRRVASGRGLTALFAGPPGTGKTMAAQVLSRELELDCFRVDLSRVMSKYIGETEQNLGKVFDQAEAGGAVLFFDEADVLFGKRSEVRDARDRYANLEVGYLLQRMEQYDGVAVLASNRMADMDEAFLRRFQVVARFRLPLPEERRRIWAGLLPAECDRADDVDLGALAEAVELSGGEIKNCVLAAAYLAAGQGAPVGMAHLVAAVRRELGKSGRLVDEAALEGLVRE